MKNNTSISKVMTIVRDMYCKEYTKETNQAQSLYSKCYNIVHDETLHHHVNDIQQQECLHFNGKYNKYILSFPLVNLFFNE